MNPLPPSLVRFETLYEDAIGRERTLRPRRVVVRGGLAAAAAAALVLGLLGVLPNNGPSVVERAAAALRVSDGTILHVVVTGNFDGGPTRLETWEESSPPYAEREISVRAGRVVESATANGLAQLYDPATNTIYATTLAALGKVDPSKPGGAVPAHEGDHYRAKILGLLESGTIRNAGHETVAGRDVIRLASDDGSLWLLVDASTYDPIEWHVTKGGQRADATFPVYERLPATTANASVLSLAAQHPGATTDDDPADYAAAVLRVAGKDIRGSHEKGHSSSSK